MLDFMVFMKNEHYNEISMYDLSQIYYLPTPITVKVKSSNHFKAKYKMIFGKQVMGCKMD
jgi:hypothetical protein